MSLLDGFDKALLNPIFDDAMEAQEDMDFEFELALEASVDKFIELSEKDYAAILDDNNPDNIVADITTKDESVSKIAEDAIDDDLKSLESLLDELENMEYAYESSSIPDDDPADDPEAEESFGEDDDYVSLDSLLDSVFSK